MQLFIDLHYIPFPYGDRNRLARGTVFDKSVESEQRAMVKFWFTIEKMAT